MFSAFGLSTGLPAAEQLSLPLKIDYSAKTAKTAD
jgi:hypothetical protein